MSMIIDNRAVGGRIAALRQRSALTQQQLAAMLCVSHQAVSKWEKGQSLPDLQTLMELAQYFGCTVEQLVFDSAAQPDGGEDKGNVSETESNEAPENGREEAGMMSFQQLLQMAPFMSKEAVEEIVNGMDIKLSGAQIARIAPFVRTECVEMLVEKYHPDMTWDTLRRITPYMSREAVDTLARQIANGEKTVRTPDDDINKTIGDIGKAFDDFGKGMGKTFDDIGKGVDKVVRKAVKFGGNVINEISSAINELSSDASDAPEAATVRSERAVAVRKKAFERALADGRWEWIGAHIGEIDGDAALKARIAARARELNMHEWICSYMGGYADESTIEAAIEAGNWSWLGENAWHFEPDMQARVALAAMRAENWQWLGSHAAELEIEDCAPEIARTAMKSGAAVLAAQIAEEKLLPEQVDALAQEAYQAGDFDVLDLLVGIVGKTFLSETLMKLAQDGQWARVESYMPHANPDIAEKLTEIAVEQGDFDAVDMLDKYL